MENDNINDILGIDNTQDNTSKITGSEETKYPALRTISIIYLILAWIIVIVAIFASLYFLSESNVKIFALVSIIIGGILALSLAAISEAIKVFVDIEYNTRRKEK